MPKHLGEPHDCEFLGVGQHFAARGLHARSCNAHDAHARQSCTQHLDQCGTEAVSRGLARHQGDHGRRPRSRIGRRDSRGHAALAYRMMLRVERPMKSIIGWISGCVVAASRRRTSASSSVSSKR